MNNTRSATHRYIGVIHKQRGSAFGVSFPDLPGCIGAGKTLDGAARSAEEALSLHIEGMIDDGEPLPQPRSLDDLLADDLAVGASATIVVAARAIKTRSVRVNVTLEEDLLRALDEHATVTGFSRSALLAQGARRVLGAS